MPVRDWFSTAFRGSARPRPHIFIITAWPRPVRQPSSQRTWVTSGSINSQIPPTVTISSLVAFRRQFMPVAIVMNTITGIGLWESPQEVRPACQQQPACVGMHGASRHGFHGHYCQSYYDMPRDAKICYYYDMRAMFVC